MSFARRQLRVRVLEALENRAKQFRTYEDLYPFRVPHEPLDLEPLIQDALGGAAARLAPEDLRSRTVLRMEWLDAHGQAPHVWEAWAIALPSGIMLYCDSDGDEARILASVRRGNPIEADGFFLELLAESRGGHFGIELGGAAPDRIRTSLTDRDLLVDVLVELFEGTAGESAIRNALGSKRAESDLTTGESRRATDFRAEVEQWLDKVLVASTAPSAGRKRARRLRDEPR